MSPRRAALIGVVVLLFAVLGTVGTHYVERWTDADTAATALGVATVVLLFLVAALVLVKRGNGGDDR